MSTGTSLESHPGATHDGNCSARARRRRVVLHDGRGAPAPVARSLVFPSAAEEEGRPAQAGTGAVSRRAPGTRGAAVRDDWSGGNSHLRFCLRHCRRRGAQRSRGPRRVALELRTAHHERRVVAARLRRHSSTAASCSSWSTWRLSRKSAFCWSVVGGRLALVVVYLGAGIVAGLVDLFLQPMTVSVGASAAVFSLYGLLAASAIWMLRRRADTALSLRAARRLLPIGVVFLLVSPGLMGELGTAAMRTGLVQFGSD